MNSTSLCSEPMSSVLCLPIATSGTADPLNSPKAERRKEGTEQKEAGLRTETDRGRGHKESDNRVGLRSGGGGVKRRGGREVQRGAEEMEE